MTSPIPIDLQLLRRFDKPGPRYTSYPTAPLFSEQYGPKQFEVDLITNNHEESGPLSLYLHIPFCDTLCYFCGCTTVVTSNRRQIADYVEQFKREIDRTARYIDKKRPVVQLHFGGGTPSYLLPEQIRDLGASVRRQFPVSEDAEISAEIDPRGLTREHLEAFRSLGVNRISVGVQDFDERVQAAVHRIQPESLTRQTVEWAQEVGIEHINFDLIYGLPRQTPGSFEHTLRKVVELSPSRIAVFNFAYVPWIKPHQKLIHPEDLLLPEVKLQLLKLTVERLTGAGYLYIGMDHFARPDDELATAQRTRTLHRNFQGYSTRADADLFGFGMSSISHFGTVYAQNAKTLAEYAQAVNAGQFATKVGYRMNRDDQVRKHVIMRLMCDLQLEKADVEERFDILFDEYFDESLNKLTEFVAAGLIEQTIEHIRVLEPGRLFLRNIAMCFDAYLERMKGSSIFSRTV
jgi:oxygen-independent coproporphyrinogen-3 oxidase